MEQISINMFDPNKILKGFLFYLHIILFLLMQSCEKDFSGLNNGIDTTSHDFQWEMITFDSPYGSGVLNDVAVIDENDIWAVGKIYSDSIQPWKPYNAVHWNGNEWEFKRIYFYSICGQTSLTPYPARSILAFDDSNIWIAMDGDQVTHLNGELQDKIICLPVSFSINKLWGENSNSIFTVGNGGNIFHYNGTTWQKIESGTDVDFRDIWGCRNSRNGEWEILAVASYGAVPSGDIAILKIEGTTVHSINTTGLPSGLSSIWFIPGQVYYAVGDGVFRTSWPGRNWQAENGHPALYKVAIRGQSKNDIFITDSFGLVSHYNGRSWHHYTGSELPTIYGGYWSISYKEDLMVAVGNMGEKGMILKGIRKQ